MILKVSFSGRKTTMCCFVVYSLYVCLYVKSGSHVITCSSRCISVDINSSCKESDRKSDAGTKNRKKTVSFLIFTSLHKCKSCITSEERPRCLAGRLSTRIKSTKITKLQKSEPFNRTWQGKKKPTTTSWLWKCDVSRASKIKLTSSYSSPLEQRSDAAGKMFNIFSQFVLFAHLHCSTKLPEKDFLCRVLACWRGFCNVKQLHFYIKPALMHNILLNYANFHRGFIILSFFSPSTHLFLPMLSRTLSSTLVPLSWSVLLKGIKELLDPKIVISPFYSS